ncbi:unnamed protein product, partial [Didymodactylos carnosus]
MDRFVPEYARYPFVNFLFACSGECLTKRLRSNAFLIILRQELGWFDKQENNTGALCRMLASDAAEIQSLAIGSIQNIRTIKQLTKENEFGNKFCSMLNKSLQIFAFVIFSMQIIQVALS